MSKLRHQQPTAWEGLFAEEVAELWEPWMRMMRMVDELLEDEALLDAVYEAQGNRHAQSRVRGPEQTPAEVTLRMLIERGVSQFLPDRHGEGAGCQVRTTKSTPSDRVISTCCCRPWLTINAS